MKKSLSYPSSDLVNVKVIENFNAIIKDLVIVKENFNVTIKVEDFVVVIMDFKIMVDRFSLLLHFEFTPNPNGRFELELR